MAGEINCFSDSALWKHPNAHIYRIIYRFWELIINANFGGGLSEGAVIWVVLRHYAETIWTSFTA